MVKKAVFLDRDGVVNEDVRYPHKPEQIVFMPGIFEFCKKIVQKGYLIVVVTNQAGIAKGYFTEEDTQVLHGWMKEKFNEQGIDIAAFYYCPFHDKGVVEKYRKNSEFRKPRPGMILKASEDLGIDVSKSFMIGDKHSDRIELEGLRSIIVKSKYTGDDYDVESLDDILKLV